MTHEQQLLQQIEQALQASTLEKNGMLEELASQLADVCDQANIRLGRCVDYLDKGMRSEAVNESRTMPDLLELESLLQGTLLDKWRNLCVDLEMPVFASLNAEALKRLKEAVAIENEMEPLLKEYRRMVYQGNRRECIDLLRKIRARDAANPSWEANLAPLETEELPKLQYQAEQALKAGDHTLLDMLYADLTHPQRAVPAPADLLERMRKELLKDRAGQLKNEGIKLQQNVETALRAPEGEHLSDLLKKMEGLEAQEAFLDKPQEWEQTKLHLTQSLEAEAIRKQEQAEQLEKVHAFQALLASGKAKEAQIRKEWELLTEQGAPVSPMLESQVYELLESKRRHRSHIRWGIFLFILAAVVLGGAAGGYMTYAKHKAEARQQVVSKLNQLKEAGKYQEFFNYCKMVELQEPVYATDSDIQTMKQEVQKIVDRQDNLTKQFASQMSALDTIREQGYVAGEEKIRKLLDEGARTAKELEDSSREERVTEWKESWQQWKQRRQEAADDELNRCISAVDTVLAEQANNPYDTLKEVLDEVAKLRQVLANGSAYLPLASNNARTRFAQAGERLKTWERTARERAQKQQQAEGKLQQARQAVLAGSSNLNQYRNALQQYVKIAPQEEPMRQECQNILNGFDVYEEAVSLGALELKMPPTKEENDRMHTWLTKNKKLAGSLWGSSLRQAQTYYEKELALVNLTKLLVANKELVDMYYVLYCSSGTNQWKRLYCTEDLLRSQSIKELQTPQKKYWGMVYQWQEGEKQPTLVHTKDVFRDPEFTTVNFDIRIKANLEENRSEFGRFITRFVVNAPGYPRTFQYLLHGILAMFDDKVIEPALQALFVQQALALLNEQYGELIPELAKVYKEFMAIDTQVPWGNPESPSVQRCVQQYQKAVQNNRKVLAELEQDLKRVLALTERILETGVSCIGTLQKDSSGKLVLKLVGGYTGEVWGIRRQNNGAEFYVISNNGRDLREDAALCCMPWMPVFAPRKGRGVLNYKLDKQDLERPAAWPVNAW